MANTEKNEERFKRIAENRTNRIIEGLRLLGNCSNRANYAYTEADVQKIFSAIEAELKETKRKFHDGRPPQKFEL